MGEKTALVGSGLFVLGMAMSILPIGSFVAKTKKSMRIERYEVFRTLRWIVVCGLWSGFFMALTFISIMMETPDTSLSGCGIAAVLLTVPVACTVILVGGFLLEVLHLRTFILPAMQERPNKAPPQDSAHHKGA